MASDETGGRRMKLGWLAPLDESASSGTAPRFRDVLAMAQAAEDIGLDSFWLADHFFYQPPEGPAVGQWEALTFLSALAAITSRIQLGPMVAATAFRNPALLAKMAASLDEISDGRFILGIGAGWHEPEYRAFGYPFDHRAARFEEALQIVVPLLREGHVDFTGHYSQARNCPLRPRGPSPRGPRFLIGAKRPRMLRLVARYADAWNTAWHTQPEQVAAAWSELLAACAEVGRDPATLELTAGVPLRITLPGETPPSDEKAITGTPEQVAEALRGFAAVGVRHVIVVLEPDGLDGLARFGRVVELLDQDS